MNGSDPKQIARELLQEAHPSLVALSHWIHANPELGYQEVLASGWVSEWLTTAGFDVRTGLAGMPTAIVGSYGPGPFHIAICAEYDALPAVGHACGHNVIAAAGVGAGIALAAVADQLGLKVTVMGTPAEETGGGKVGLIKAGEFDGVHAAMMVHPWPQDEATPTIIAIRSLNVTYTGREAHAAGFPYLGVNAADAFVVAQTAIALLRQQLRSGDRVHGIVTKGGDAANIIPARTEGQWMVRGPNLERLDEVTELVRRCFEAGALATGATLGIEEEICYADVRHDPDLARIYQANAEQLGRVFSDPGMPVSTDMGNVSYVVPTIHPMLGIEAGGAVNHQADFAAACATPSADEAILDGATAMAWTAIDAAMDEGLRRRLMESQPDRSEVATVSAAWAMPAVAEDLIADAATEEAVAEDLIADAATEEAVAEDLIADAATEEAVAEDLIADAATEEAVAEDLIADAATEEAVAEDLIADAATEEAVATDLIADAATEEAVATDLIADAATEEAVAEDLIADAATEEAVAEDLIADAEVVRDPWAAPQAFGEWTDAAAPSLEATPEVDLVAEATAVAAAAWAPEGPEAPDTPEALEAPMAPEAAPESAAEVVAPPVASRMWARDEWERAFEEAAASVGWDQQFEEAITERMDEEGMDRSEAMIDLASDLQEAADDGLPAESLTEDRLPDLDAWPPQGGETVSRERIEAEGFAFAAPALASAGDDHADAWWRNGNDPSGEDVGPR